MRLKVKGHLNRVVELDAAGSGVFVTLGVIVVTLGVIVVTLGVIVVTLGVVASGENTKHRFVSHTLHLLRS